MWAGYDGIVALLIDKRTLPVGWLYRTLAWTFWGSSALLVVGMAAAMPFGASFLLVPVLVAALVTRRGIEQCPTIVLGAGVTGMVTGSVVIGQSSSPGPVAAIVLGYMGWSILYPLYLRTADDRFQWRNEGSPRARGGPLRCTRLHTVHLWATAAFMLAAGVSSAVPFMVLAAVRRRRWTLTLAAVSCLVLPFVTVVDGNWAWDVTYLAVIAAVVGAYRCWATLRAVDPGFRRRNRSGAVPVPSMPFGALPARPVLPVSSRRARGERWSLLDVAGLRPPPREPTAETRRTAVRETVQTYLEVVDDLRDVLEIHRHVSEGER